MQTKRLLTVLSVLLCAGAIVAGALLLKNRNYYLVSAAILLFSCLPFCLRLRTIRTREMVVVATMVAVAVASRAAFYMLPSVKPMCAIVILTGIAFGPQIGFLTGAFSMFLSNFLFGQGAWTPFQVFGMGLTAFVASFLLRVIRMEKSRIACALIGAAACFLIYGGIVDTGSVLLMARTYTVQSVMAIYAGGIPFNAVHSATTAVVLFLLCKPVQERLERMKIKYGLFS